MCEYNDEAITGFKCENYRELCDKLDFHLGPPCFEPLTTQKEPVADVPLQCGVIKPCPFCGEQPVEGEMGDINEPIKTARCVTERCPLQEIIVSLDGWQKRAL